VARAELGSLRDAAHVSEEAARRAELRSSVTLGPIPVQLSAESQDALELIAPSLLGSLPAYWKPLDVVIMTADGIPEARLPVPLRPRGIDVIVMREGELTSIASGPDGTSLVLDDRRSLAVLWTRDLGSLPPAEYTSPLRGAARWWATRNGGAMVHAGAVADDERCVLLVGDAGAGKSTTTMACFGQGLDVLGDDFCLVEPPTSARPPVAHAMYSRAKLDEQSLSFYPSLREHVVGTGWRGKKLIDLGAQARSPREVVAVCHVVQDPAGPTRVEAESRARTLRAVAPSTLFQQRLWEHEMWAVLTSVVRSVPCYRLSVSAVGAVPGVVRSLLEETE
jgi:hypothetical protein